jgi:uncharacterized membrane protein
MLYWKIHRIATWTFGLASLAVGILQVMISDVPLPFLGLAVAVIVWGELLHAWHRARQRKQ